MNLHICVYFNISYHEHILIIYINYYIYYIIVHMYSVNKCLYKTWQVLTEGKFFQIKKNLLFDIINNIYFNSNIL